jgi:acetyl esterase/lipase
VPSACAQAPKLTGYRVIKDLDYVGKGNARQCLDIYLPEAKSEKPCPLLVFIHGGGWEGGDKNGAGALTGLLQGSGMAGASVGYRLTDQGGWPNQIHDCKAALRYLRAQAATYGYDPERIAVYGISAGGHLVSMLGVSSDVPALSGNLGAHLDQKMGVRCVIDFCGPGNFLTFNQDNTKPGAESPTGAIAKLLGGPLSQRPEQAREASPITYVSKDDPPFLIIHGTADNLVPLSQAREFDAALDKAGVSSTLVIGQDAPHVFFTPALGAKMKAFLRKHLFDEVVEVTEETLAAK